MNLGYVLGAIFGCFFCAIGILGLVSEWLFFRRAIIIPGIISESRQDGYTDSDGDPTYHAIISFEFDGEKREIKNNVSTSWEPKIGKSLRWG